MSRGIYAGDDAHPGDDSQWARRTRDEERESQMPQTVLVRDEPVSIGRKALDQTARDFAPALHRALDELFGASKVGFALVLFDFGERGHMSYISNGHREGMVSLLKEWLAKLEAGLTTDPPGPTAEG